MNAFQSLSENVIFFNQCELDSVIYTQKHTNKDTPEHFLIAVDIFVEKIH